MGKVKDFLAGFFVTESVGKDTVKDVVDDTTPQDAAIDKLIKEMGANVASMPRSLMYGATSQQVFTSVSRDTEYLKRHELYRDPFTREMVKVIIVRAIGAEHNNTIPFNITLDDSSGIENENAKEVIKAEFRHLENLIKKDLFSVAMDSQFYGDGYSALRHEKGVGIIGIIVNFSTKPFNITPYVNNFDEEKAYEVSPNEGLLKGYASSKRETGKTQNGRRYVDVTKVARMNAKENGILELQTTSVTQIENMNAFNENESMFEDIVYGGVTEGCSDSFENFKWAINSLANMRISSSVIERWIIHNLQATSENERKLFKATLEQKITATRDKLKSKVETKDSTANIITHTIPTGMDGTGGIEIQESNINFNQQIDDIMIHIKRYLGDIGFNIDLTPYGSSPQGGGERDGTTQNSLQMDVQGEQIRGAMTGYILHIMKMHFLIKYGKTIDTNKVKIEFNSIINKARIDAETQRMEAVGNTQQISGLLLELREAGYEDNEDNKYFLKEMLRDVVSNNTVDKEKMIDAMIVHILTKPKVEDNPDDR